MNVIKIIFLTILWASSCLCWSATYTAAEHLARAKEIHTIINGIRTKPSEFVPKLEAKKAGWSGNEGVEVVQEAIDAINPANFTPNTENIIWSDELAQAALDHATDLGTNGTFSHDSGNGDSFTDRISRYASNYGLCGEIIAAGGHSDPTEFVLMYMIDDGVPSRGHRKNILKAGFHYIGVGNYKHKVYGQVTAADFAGSITTKIAANGCPAYKGKKLGSSCIYICPDFSTEGQSDACTCDTNYTQSEDGLTCRKVLEVTKGNFLSNLPEGTALSTKFTFTATNSLPGEGNTLEYKFSVKIGNREFTLGEFGSSRTITKDLPPGEEPDYRVIVVVTAKNTLGLTASMNVTVIVRPPEGGIDPSILTERLESGTLDERIVTLGIFAGLTTAGQENISISTGECSKCSPTNGKCDSSTSYLCECASGFAVPYCTMTTMKSEENINIMRAVSKSISNILESVSSISSRQLDSILETALECSNGYAMGDTEANINMEDIQQKYIELLTVDISISTDTANSLLKLTSNCMGGISAESLRESSDKSTLNTRMMTQTTNLKKISKKLMKTQNLGSKIQETRTESFEITGISNSCKSLGGLKLTTTGGPLLSLPHLIGCQDENENVGIHYYYIKVTSPTLLNLRPFSNILDIECNGASDGNRCYPGGDEWNITWGKGQFVRGEVDGGDPPTCAYYNQEAEVFETDGVETLSLDEISYICSTTHLSQFAMVPIPLVTIVSKDNEDNNDSDGGSNVGLIVGLTVTFVVLILIGLGVAGYIYWKKRKDIEIGEDKKNEEIPKEETKTESKDSNVTKEEPLPTPGTQLKNAKGTKPPQKNLTVSKPRFAPKKPAGPTSQPPKPNNVV